MSINGLMDKDGAINIHAYIFSIHCVCVYIYIERERHNAKIVSHEVKRNSAIYNNIAGCWGCYVKWVSQRKTNAIHYILHMEYKKKKKKQRERELIKVQS